MTLLFLLLRERPNKPNEVEAVGVISNVTNHNNTHDLPKLRNTLVEYVAQRILQKGR